MIFEDLLEHVQRVDDRIIESLREEFVHQSVVEESPFSALAPSLILIFEHPHALAVGEVDARIWKEAAKFRQPATLDVRRKIGHVLYVPLETLHDTRPSSIRRLVCSVD